MNDFATEEFLNKNIRVRPLSGLSRGGGEEAKQDKNPSDPYNQGEDAEKFNQMKILEMEEERQQIKEQKENYMRRKRAEEEKLKKKKWCCLNII